MGKPEICAAFIYEDGKNKLQIPPENYKRKRIIYLYFTYNLHKNEFLLIIYTIKR